MTKFYATLDNDGLHINSNAAIYTFNTAAEAEAFLRGQYSDAPDIEVVSVTEGEWGDCWVKSLHQPRVGDTTFKPFTYNQLIISRPNTHPEGLAWWITPRPAVLVAITREARR